MDYKLRTGIPVQTGERVKHKKIFLPGAVTWRIKKSSYRGLIQDININLARVRSDPESPSNYQFTSVYKNPNKFVDLSIRKYAVTW
jgi:hypothetical protein